MQKLNDVDFGILNLKKKIFWQALNFENVRTDQAINTFNKSL